MEYGNGKGNAEALFPGKNGLDALWGERVVTLVILHSRSILVNAKIRHSV